LQAQELFHRFHQENFSAVRHYKAIVVIIKGFSLAADNTLYDKFEAVWRRYKDLRPDKFRVFFLQCREDSTQPLIYWEDEHTLCLNTEESYVPGILLKTLAAMHFCLQEYQFDYFVRTNLSTFINWDSFERTLDTFPKTQLCAGHKEPARPEPTPLFPVGSRWCAGPVTLSRDLVYQLLDHVEKQPLENLWMQSDDVAMFECLRRITGKIDHRTQLSGLWFSDHGEVDDRLKAKLKEPDVADWPWYRVRNWGSDRHQVDVYIHEQLYSRVYQQIHKVNLVGVLAR
jgi:hypothetical protein